jgi:hypothetical protein
MYILNYYCKFKRELIKLQPQLHIILVWMLQRGKLETYHQLRTLQNVHKL